MAFEHPTRSETPDFSAETEEDPFPALRVAGETFRLLPEGAALWEEEGTLLVADPHFGKAATFRAAGLPVPAGTTGRTLDRLDAALGRFPIQRLVFLGDLLHARTGRAPGTLSELTRWRGRHAGLEITLVRGNHDRGAGDPPADLGIRCVDAPLILRGLALSHHPDPISGHYVIGGHLHPAVRLWGRGRQSKRLPCFLFGSDAAILPAFGDFTGTAVVQPSADDRVFVLAADEVIEVSGPGGSEGSSPVGG